MRRAGRGARRWCGGRQSLGGRREPRDVGDDKSECWGGRRIHPGQGALPATTPTSASPTTAAADCLSNEARPAAGDSVGPVCRHHSAAGATQPAAPRRQTRRGQRAADVRRERLLVPPPADVATLPSVGRRAGPRRAELNPLSSPHFPRKRAGAAGAACRRAPRARRRECRRPVKHCTLLYGERRSLLCALFHPCLSSTYCTVLLRLGRRARFQPAVQLDSPITMTTRTRWLAGILYTSAYKPVYENRAYERAASCSSYESRKFESLTARATDGGQRPWCALARLCLDRRGIGQMPPSSQEHVTVDHTAC